MDLLVEVNKHEFEILKMTGDMSLIEQVRNKLSKLFADIKNHERKFTLVRQPTQNERKMISDYMKKLGAKAQFDSNNDICELTVFCKEQAEVTKFVAQSLTEFLRMDFPDEWENSLNQFCN